MGGVPRKKLYWDKKWVILPCYQSLSSACTVLDINTQTLWLFVQVERETVLRCFMCYPRTQHNLSPTDGVSKQITIQAVKDDH